MTTARLEFPADYPTWRKATIQALNKGVYPEEMWWEPPDQSGQLFGGDAFGTVQKTSLTRNIRLDASFERLARQVICHSATDRLDLMYRVAWRLSRGEPELLGHSVDSDVHRLNVLAKEVRRDAHKMKAFVRFREMDEQLVAWFEPEHHIVDALAKFFVNRFANEKWAILTPYRSAHWDTQSLRVVETPPDVLKPPEDDLENYWRKYYASIFNPARLKVPMMQQEMPKKYWKNLPEARLIPELVAGAQARSERMIDTAVTEPARKGRTSYTRNAPKVSSQASPLEQLGEQISNCQNCPLWRPATQAVSGEGPPDAQIMLIGEQPGDQEDLRGRPFVGPAGQVLDGAFQAVGLDRKSVYLTNAVKHFHFEARGKVRLHKGPKRLHVDACWNWLEQELALVNPNVVITLGATALWAMTGGKQGLSSVRGQLLETEAFSLIPTWHPAAILRSPNGRQMRHELKNDIALAASIARQLAA